MRSIGAFLIKHYKFVLFWFFSMILTYFFTEILSNTKDAVFANLSAPEVIICSPLQESTVAQIDRQGSTIAAGLYPVDNLTYVIIKNKSSFEITDVEVFLSFSGYDNGVPYISKAHAMTNTLSGRARATADLSEKRFSLSVPYFPSGSVILAEFLFWEPVTISSEIRISGDAKFQVYPPGVGCANGDQIIEISNVQDSFFLFVNEDCEVASRDIDCPRPAVPNVEYIIQEGDELLLRYTIKHNGEYFSPLDYSVVKPQNTELYYERLVH